jgi:hypothetical protein
LAGGINERILKLIYEKTADDPPIKDFLKDSLFEESNHSGSWWYKDYYKKKIQQSSRNWGGKNED